MINDTSPWLKLTVGVNGKIKSEIHSDLLRQAIAAKRESLGLDNNESLSMEAKNILCSDESLVKLIATDISEYIFAMFLENGVDGLEIIE